MGCAHRDAEFTVPFRCDRGRRTKVVPRREHQRSPLPLLLLVAVVRAGWRQPLAAEQSHLPGGHYCNLIEAPWLVNGGHGASLRHHKQASQLRNRTCPSGPTLHAGQPGLGGVSSAPQR
eukprot:COSAG01_NODE_458_length_16743_cov_124.609208_17_plen_119_part_00